MLLAAILLVAGAGGVVLSLPRHGPTTDRLAGGRIIPPRINPELAAAAAARKAAVNWILQQVSRAAVVSCDPQVCSELASMGYPNLLPLEPTSNDPLGSTLVVATAAIRAQFGARLASVYAPAVIASFGSGSAKIEIRLLYPGGAASYDAALQADLSARKIAYAQLLTNTQITFSPRARAQLLSGDVDPRLPQLLAIMAHSHRLSVVTFVNQSPGGGPTSLMRSMDLATVDPSGQLTRAAYLGWIQSVIDVQLAPYHPNWAQQVRRAGQTVLMIGFGAPSPLSPIS
jgi:hypothetical protein